MIYIQVAFVFLHFLITFLNLFFLQQNESRNLHVGIYSCTVELETVHLTD